MTSSSTGVAVFAILIALAGPALSETLEEAIAKAYASNPTLVGARAELRALDEGVAAARAGMLPNVEAVATVGVNRSSVNGPTTGVSTEPRSIGLNASQVLYNGGRTSNQVASAVSAVDAGRSSLTNIEQNILLQVVTAYSDVRRDQQFVVLARNNVRVIKEQLRASEDRFEVGEVTRTDVSQARARLAQAEAALAAREGALARSFQAYGRVVGSPPGELSELPPIPPLPPTMADAVQEAYDLHPLVKAARYREKAARSDIASAQGVLLPTVTLSGTVSYAEDQSATVSSGVSSAQIQLQARVPLYQGGAAYSGVRRAKAVQSQRMSEIHGTSRQVREAVENAWTDLETAQISIRAGKSQVAAAQLAFEGVREEAKLGSRTTLDVLDAEQETLNAKTNLIASERDEYVAAYTLLAAIGRLTVAGLDVDVAPYEPDENYQKNSDRLFGFERDELTEWKTEISP